MSPQITPNDCSLGDVMKRISILVILVVISALFSGCTAFVKYDLSLKGVDGYNKKSITGKNTFEDGNISIVFKFNPVNEMIDFKLENKTDGTITVLWDQAAYIDLFRGSHRITHREVNLDSRSDFQCPTSIPKGAILSDIILPTNYVYARESSGRGFSWWYKPLIPNRMTTPEEVKELASSYVGRKIKVLLRIGINNKEKEYLFTFNIDNFTLCRGSLEFCGEDNKKGSSKEVVLNPKKSKLKKINY